LAHRDSGGYIGSDLMVQGRLSGKASLAVDGRLGGDVRLDGTLERMVARCQVGGLVVRGEVVGEIEAAGVVEVRSGGVLTGEVFAATLLIEPGGRFRGSARVEEVEVRGLLVGQVDASERAWVGDGAAVVGDLRAPEVEAGRGALLRGSEGGDRAPSGPPRDAAEGRPVGGGGAPAPADPSASAPSSLRMPRVRRARARRRGAPAEEPPGREGYPGPREPSSNHPRRRRRRRGTPDPGNGVDG